MAMFDLFKRRATPAMAAPPVAEAPEPARPTFVFVDDEGGASAWRVRDELGRIHAAARQLAAELPAGAPVGLLFRSGPDLVATWFACLHAGLRPLIMQYPTRKQSRAYWFDSVTNTIATASLAGVIADAYCAELGLPPDVRVISHAALPTTPVADPGPMLPERFSILQLSSGTTGYRKAMEFGSVALARHAEDYNRVLRLNPARDRIVSWLPLYHDMGYVACFVMPILLGIDVVMMDPVTWVQRPELLWDAIEQHRGTICYMPNFGFEVMTRAPARPLLDMRHWISCSEPVSATTAAKFIAHVGADPVHFNPCYAMAENLFAVTFGAGAGTRLIDGAEVVSCGRPIPGVELKIMEDEIWVRSPTSLEHYFDGADIRDADGYYATGDMGSLLDGELYVSGRKQDVLIQAGRKFMLSDIDLRLNEEFPHVRGRGVALALRDDRLGTETPLILIEALDFFDRTDMRAISQRLTDLLGIDQLEVAYVPPRFLTKTSSGKFNRRKTRADWLAVQDAKHRTAGPRDLVAELRGNFDHVDWTRPIKEVLDSLSTTIIKIMLEQTAVPFDGAQSLTDLAASLKSPDKPVMQDLTEGLRLISLSDLRTLGQINDNMVVNLGRKLGCPVTIEHICLPPSPIALSDLIFHDWFQPRLDQAPFTAVDEVMARLKNASAIIVDNIAELQFLGESTYPVLSHNLERDPSADLLCVRWPNYIAQHHKLPLTYVSGADIPIATTNTTIGQLSRYLGVPIFRAATAPGYDKYCHDWDYVPEPRTPENKANRATLISTLTDWLKGRPELRRTAIRPETPIVKSDMAHFCAVMANKDVVDFVIGRYNSFYIGGQKASLPYLQKRLDELGKPYVVLPSLKSQIVSAFPEKYECMVATGVFGMPQPDVPFVAFQHIGQGFQTRDLGPTKRDLVRHGNLSILPPSMEDWFHNFPLDHSRASLEEWKKARYGHGMRGAAAAVEA